MQRLFYWANVEFFIAFNIYKILPLALLKTLFIGLFITKNRPWAVLVEGAETWSQRLLIARHFAFNALDVELHTAQELVVGDDALGEHFLAILTHDWPSPRMEAA